MLTITMQLYVQRWLVDIQRVIAWFESLQPDKAGLKANTV